MAYNLHSSGGAATGSELVFDKPVKHILLWVDAGVVFDISFDGGDNYITYVPGNHQFPVGLIDKVKITSNGSWGIVGIP